VRPLVHSLEALDQYFAMQYTVVVSIMQAIPVQWYLYTEDTCRCHWIRSQLERVDPDSASRSGF